MWKDSGLAISFDPTNGFTIEDLGEYNNQGNSRDLEILAINESGIFSSFYEIAC